MTRKPLLNFAAAALLIIAAGNEGHLNHWGITIVLLVIAGACIAAAIWGLRERE
jgi:hypothetical protein